MSFLPTLIWLLSLLSIVFSKNRIRHVPQIDPEAAPSVVWTETIDEKNVKLAALSFRVILPSMSDARWITEALKRVSLPPPSFKYAQASI